MSLGKRKYPVGVFGLCLMPNHFHAIVQPNEHGALSAYLRWVLGGYGCDFRIATQSVGHGHVFKGRFWNNIIDGERHFLTVLRYIEANPVRANLVKSAEQWQWSSIVLRSTNAALLDALPVAIPANWVDVVNAPMPLALVDAVWSPPQRGRPTLHSAAQNIVLRAADIEKDPHV